MFYICRSSELWWYWSLDVATVLGWFWWILWQHWPSGVSLCWAATWGSSPSIHHLIVWYQSQSDWKASVLARQVSLMPLSSVQPGLIFSLDWYPFLKVFSSTLSFLESYMTRGAFLDRSPDNFSSMKSCHEKLFCVCWVYIQDESFNYFENDKIKVQVNETKLTGLWARKCANIQQVLISKFPFDPELPVTAHTDPCLFYSLWCHLSVRKFCFLCMPELPKLIFYILIRWSWSLWHVNDFLVRFSSL